MTESDNHRCSRHGNLLSDGRRIDWYPLAEGLVLTVRIAVIIGIRAARVGLIPVDSTIRVGVFNAIKQSVAIGIGILGLSIPSSSSI